MKRAEHILTTLGEEAVEVAQRASKALRFGLKEVQPGQPLSNASRIREEMKDLLGMYIWGFQEGLLPRLDLTPKDVASYAADKRAKVERFMAISRTQGTLQEGLDLASVNEGLRVARVCNGATLPGDGTLDDLIRVVKRAMWDPGAIVGARGDRSLAEWQEAALKTALQGNAQEVVNDGR